MTETRTTVQLLDLIEERSTHPEITTAVADLRRRGDTLVRREDLWVVLEYADSDEVLLESERDELKAAFARIQSALGKAP